MHFKAFRTLRLKDSFVIVRSKYCYRHSLDVLRCVKKREEFITVLEATDRFITTQKHLLLPSLHKPYLASFVNLFCLIK